MSFQTTAYGKYFLLERIAVGGMAEVFKAKTFGVRGFERLLVIKRILPSLSKDDEFVEMFIDEAKISVELTHANICQVTDLGKLEDNYFIAMEYIDGKDLRAILKKCYTTKTAFPVPQAVYIAIELLKGLDYAHRRIDSNTGRPLGIIHRDISPQNIMISYDGEVKIVDFGIAKTESKLNRTQAGVLKGKFGYMSPEQAAGMELDARTDLFSAGILLFEMLTGRRLFLGENDFETLEKIKECNVPSPSKYNPEIPPALEQIVFKALAKETENRFSTTQELHAALSRLFYTSYTDFSAKQLSESMKSLFATEIVAEQESLRRAIDSLPKADIQSAIREEETPSLRRREAGTGFEPRQRTAAPSPPIGWSVEIEEPSAFRKFISLTARLIVLAATMAAGGWLAWKFLTPSEPPVTVQPVPPKPSRAAGMMVKITSDPAGATLSINDEVWGETPVSRELPPKKWYTLRLEKSGFKPLVEKLFVTEDETQYGPFRMKADLPEVGVLRVSSDPPGATIYIDQEKTDFETPYTLENVKLNVDHVVKVYLEGYKAEKKKVRMERAEQEVTFELEQNIAKLTFRITPKDARVFINGAERGQVIDDLTPNQEYDLRVEADGYEPYLKRLRLPATGAVLPIELKKKAKVTYGTVNIGSTPWASIYIDGDLVGETPVMEHRLKAGEHVIEFRNSAYPVMRKKVVIREGENPPVRNDFR